MTITIRLSATWSAMALGTFAMFGIATAQTPTSEPTSYAAAIRAKYVPLSTLMSRSVPLPERLERHVSVELERVPLQRALVEIATQARLGLSYGEDVASANRLVTVSVDRATAAEALELATRGTPWTAMVTATGQVLVVRTPAGGVRVPQGTIVGRVTDSAGKTGIKAAEVFLERTAWRTITDSLGEFRFAQVDTGQYVLVVRRFGYSKGVRRVTVVAGQDDTVNVALKPAAVALNELVATATGQQRRRDIGNAITTIRADSVLRSGANRTLTDLLANRVPGMSLQHTSGAPGDPARIRFRGLGSAMRNNDPVVIVDQVRVYATQSSARSGNLTNLGTNLDAEFTDRATGKRVPTTLSGDVPAPSPLDQIDPNIIEKIEVFKGPSAATLYGADAANGVIVITTKRGKPGPTIWNASFTYGRTTPAGPHPQGYFRWGHLPIEGSLSICPLVYGRCEQDSLVRYQALNDPDMTVFGVGHRSAVTLSASGGSQALTYSITGSYGDETGLLRLPNFELTRFESRFNRQPSDWMQRPHSLKDWNITSNLTAILGPTAEVTLSNRLSRSEQHRTSLENQVARMGGAYIDKINGIYYFPTVLNSPSVPGTTVYGLTASTDAVGLYYQRTTASTVTFASGLNASWRPRPWFNAAGQAGVDIVPREDMTFRPGGLLTSADSGGLVRGTGRSVVGTFNLQGTLRKQLRWGFVFETSLGANVVTTTTNDLISSAAKLAPGTSSFSGAKRFTSADSRINTSVFGWYIEPRITGQRLSLSTGIRLDGGSAYGARVTGFGSGPGRGFLRGLLALPKLNGSWVISEEPFFPFKALFSSLRLRGAYGQAQVQPGAIDRLRIYTRRLDGLSELLELTSVGNNALRPERSTEFEGGLDADLLDSRVSLEFTGYRKLQVDALMPVNLPTSINGGGTIIQNIGNIVNTGVEVTARITPVQSSFLTFSSEFNYAHNHNTLVKLGPGVDPNPRQGLVAGYPVAGRWSRPIVGYADRNENGVLDVGEVRVGDSLVYMGRLQPAYEMSMHTNVALFNGAVGVTAGFNYEAGATQIDQTAKTNWVLSRALADPATPLDQQAAAMMFNVTDYGLTQTVSTFRFNSFAVNYRAPRRVTRLIGAQQFTVSLQGDNLGMHSTYRGKDPDVTAWGAGEHIVDTGQLARPRTWQLALYLQY